MASNPDDYAYESHLAEWHDVSTWLLTAVPEFFIAFGELKRAHDILLRSVVGSDLAKELRDITNLRHVLAHELTGMIEDTDDDPGLLRNGDKRITPEELSAYIQKCRELTELLKSLTEPPS